MLPHRLIPCLVALFSLFIFPVSSSVAHNPENGSPDHDSSEAATQKNESPESPDARPQMVKITTRGISPSQLSMQQADSIVFFYNDTEDDLVTLEVEFDNRAVHCGAALKVVKEPGLARSRKPFGPKEFASTCFHDKGQYTYKVYTSRKGKSPYTGTVTVQ